MIGEYTSWFENLDIYQEWMKNLPEPLNNAAFASAVFLGAVFFLLTAVVNRILLIRWNARQRKARRRMEEQRRQEMEEQRERERHSREDREQMDLYLRFLMTAQMQNFTSLQGITFGQWKAQMLAEQAACEAGLAEGMEKEAGTEAETRVMPAEKEEMAAVEPEPLEIMPVSGDTGAMPADGERKWEDSASEVLTVQIDENCPSETSAEEICMPEKRNVFGVGIVSQENREPETAGQETPVERNLLGFGAVPEEKEPLRFTGEIELPMRRMLDDTVEETAESRAALDSLRSVDMAAVMEQIRRDGDSGAAGELSSEQQSDFAKVLAQMWEDASQQDYLQRFQREKSEIIRNNLSVLDKSIYALGKNYMEEKDVERETVADEEMERRKEAAREAIRQAERLEQEKGKKKGLFRRRK